MENIALPVTNTGMIEVNLNLPVQQPKQLRTESDSAGTTQNYSESRNIRQSDTQTIRSSGTPGLSEPVRSKNHPFVVEELDEKV